MRLTENTGRQKSPKDRHGHHRTTLSGYIFATEACIDSRKKLLNSNMSPTSPYNMVIFRPLAAEIGSLVWGTPANFSGFLVEQSVSPIFGRAAITLGIGPHSSLITCYKIVFGLVDVNFDDFSA